MKTKSNAFSKFLLSYIIILIIPLVISGIAYIPAGNIVEEESNHSSIAMLNQTKQVIDSKLREVELLAQQISLNKRVKSFVYTRSPLDKSDIYKAAQIIEDFSSYRNLNTFITDFYVYFKNSDVILTSTSKYSPELFYNNIYMYGNQPYETWYNQTLKYRYIGEYTDLLTITATPYNAQEEMITYIKSICENDMNDPEATIVILLNKRKIQDLLKNIAGSGQAYIIDKDNRVVLSSSDENGYVPQYDELPNKEGLLSKKVAGNRFGILYTSSEQNSWKYVAVVPRESYMRKVDYVRSIIINAVLICLALGLIISYSLAHKTYRPIISTIEEDRRLKAMLDQQYPILKANLLSKLIKGKIGNYNTIKESLNLYRINFISDNFIVALFHIDDCSKFVRNETEQERSLAKFTITNLIEEMINQKHKAYMIELEDDTLALIINSNPDIKVKDAGKEIKALIKEIKDLICMRYGILLTVSIGNFHHYIDGIKSSYQEALKAMDYKMIKGNNALISYDEICKIEKEYYYPIDVEEQIINCIKTGNSDKAASLLDTIVEKNFIKRNLPSKLMQCLFFDIMSTAIKIINELNVNYNDVFSSNYDPIERLLQCQTVNEMKASIKDIYNRICSYINAHKRSHNQQLKKQIINYIEASYSDPNLSQKTIAEHLGLSTSYLSSFFKEQFGQNMVEYIGRFRIEQAKKLLLDDKLTVIEIAKAVGFSNDMRLIRSFKRFEGITPGQYREMIKQGLIDI